MKFGVALVAAVHVGLLAFTDAGAVAQTDGSVAAVQKVIQMLNNMMVTAKQEKADEEIAFAEFKTWCSEESVNLKGSIKRGAQRIESLSASMEKLESETKDLGEAIAKLHADMSTAEADIKAATVQREQDHAAHTAEATDYSESVDALDRAIQVLQKQDYDRTGTALLQLAEQDRIPAEAKSIISAFLGMMKDDPMAYEAPEANAYEFQSGSIVALLNKLKDDFRAKLGESQKEEMNSKHAYDMIVQDLRDSIDNSNRDAEEKTGEKNRKIEKTAFDTKERSETINTKKEDESTVNSMTTECAEKKLSFDEKQQLRAEEIEAIAKAMEILSSPDVSGNAEKHLDFAQARSGVSFVQRDEIHNAAGDRSEGIRRRVREFLSGESSRLHSQQLGFLAEKLAADPFAKVKKLIDDMITRLLEEANADAEHEGFCDKEMGKNKVTRTKLSEDIDALDAAIEDGKATAMQLTSDVATLTQEVQALDEAMGEASKLRKAESTKNAATVSDAKSAQVAVTQAIAVLKEYYAKASAATAFVQTAGKPNRLGLLGTRGIKMGTDEWEALANPNFEGTIDKNHKAGMQTFGDTYQGQQQEAGGVLGMLEVVQSDFDTLQTDTEAAEAASQKAHDDFMIESKKNKAMKLKKADMNNADKAATEAKLQEDIADFKSNQDQLLAADRYYERLVPQCIDKGMTYDEKVAAREAEITSLKEALKILGSEDIGTSAL